MAKDECPCNGCGERSATCHSTCEDRYKPWKARLDAKSRAIKESKVGNKMYAAYRRVKLKAITKAKHEKKG